jgi:hypothetical protein
VSGLPGQFVADTAAVGQGPVGCRAHLVDPRDGTRLTLIRSTSRGPDVYWGDYAVTPPARYGIGAGRLLRIECTTGHPLGAVR